jgi:hypothetical protein
VIDPRNVDVKLAADEEGHRVAELAATCGFEFPDWEINWSDVHPHWLVADHRGDLLGCLQLCYGRPVGRLEMLGVDSSLKSPTRALVVNMLLLTGCSILKEYGAQGVSGHISFKSKWFKRWLKKRGAFTIDSGNLVLFRLE